MPTLVDEKSMYNKAIEEVTKVHHESACEWWLTYDKETEKVGKVRNKSAYKSGEKLNMTKGQNRLKVCNV